MERVLILAAVGEAATGAALAGGRLARDLDGTFDLGINKR